MGPIEVLELALRKETEAKSFYEKLSLQYPATREIFTFLMNEEDKHRQLIEKRMVELQN